MINFQIATAQESTPAPSERGLFYSATRFHISVGTNDDIIISGGKNGDGQTRVDDVVTITITDQSDPNNKAVYSHDYSKNCSGDVYFLDPINLNIEDPDKFNAFRGKIISVNIKFSDKCGGMMHGTNFFLCLSPSTEKLDYNFKYVFKSKSDDKLFTLKINTKPLTNGSYPITSGTCIVKGSGDAKPKEYNIPGGGLFYKQLVEQESKGCHGIKRIMVIFSSETNNTQIFSNNENEVTVEFSENNCVSATFVSLDKNLNF
jgi:hypothetical protein